MVATMIVGGLILLTFVIICLCGFRIIGPDEVGILTKKWAGRSMPAGQIIARNGEVGIQAKTLMPGLYWRFPIVWKYSVVDVVNIESNQIGVVESIDGEPLLRGRILGDEVDCNQFQDAESFLKNHGRKGPQVAILRPGSYRINTELFKVTPADVVVIKENTVGIVVAKDGIPLPSGYIIAPKAQKDGQDTDHKFYQNGQAFLEGNGYRGPQLETLQPGKYYINPFLFNVKGENVADVLPGYVAVIRSNVGAELERVAAGPQDATGEGKLGGPIHEDVEKLLTVEHNTRGIWKDPVAPGKYNLNTIAYTPYLVPTSAITIDWASEGKIGTDVVGVEDSSVLYKFNPLKVTSMDGFLLEVNVRMVIRIQPANAAYVIARFGSVANLIDQIVHPLIDSSFRNKAGEKKAIDFFQSRTALQSEALAHAKEKFSEYNVEAQNLLIAYIDIPTKLLDTQTLKEIAAQQQQQYVQEAEAQKKRIEVEKQKGTADKQGDLARSQVEIEVKKNEAEARKNQAEGEAAYIEKTGKAQGAQVEAVGLATAKGMEAQAKALESAGGQMTAAINMLKALSEGKNKFVPEIQVLSGEGHGSGVVDALMATVAQSLQKGELPGQTKKVK